MKKKTCPKCKVLKPVSSFVTIFGFTNPRGKYCRKCYLINELSFVKRLMEGRDYCLYCGKKIKKVYEWTVEGKTVKIYINRDHMDPISLGGRDSSNNTVYCCVECNRRKSNKLFSEWLKYLTPKYRKLTKEIYIKKHRRNPENFKPRKNEIVITISLK